MDTSTPRDAPSTAPEDTSEATTVGSDPDDAPFETTDQDTESITVRESLRREFPLVLLLLAAVDLSVDGALLAVLPFTDGLVIATTFESGIPPSIYVFGMLGASAYAVTSLVFEPKESRLEVLRLGYRCVGALPLAAGVFLFSGAFVDTSTFMMPVAGLAFLAGLFVRLTLRRLGDLAEKLYRDDQSAQVSAVRNQRRMTAVDSLRQGWQQLATSQVPVDRRERARQLLDQAATIVEDQDATQQELTRARDLSKDATGILHSDSGEGGGPS